MTEIWAPSHGGGRLIHGRHRIPGLTGLVQPVPRGQYAFGPLVAGDARGFLFSAGSSRPALLRTPGHSC